MNAYSNNYRNNQVMTASPEQILIMLYDGAIRFVRQGKQAILDGRQADKATAIGKAVAIITEFSNTLDYKVGGEIALDLSQLYDFMIRELSAVNARGDAARLEPIEKILLDLREGFAGAAEINQRGTLPVADSNLAQKQIAVSF
ncbi:MAG: flagellar export chaperone FliS [Thiomicrorhabdus sp.]|jgi:flagellar protein FliS|nr:flagellar export chaperone FliS [Thiomicrorhabdus sp.]